MTSPGLTLIRWEERQFDFSFPVEAAPLLLERLRGTPARLEDRLTSMHPEHLTRRSGEAWSVQEHAGHLISVEALFLGRLDDYDAGVARLRPADMSGRGTYDADYNSRSLSSVLAGFRDVRTQMVSRLEALDAGGFVRTAMHPRLGRPMRVCDMMLFECEHDDYHLARITEILRQVSR